MMEGIRSLTVSGGDLKYGEMRSISWLMMGNGFNLTAEVLGLEYEFIRLSVE